MRTVLICHEDDPLNYTGMSRWLNSFTDLVGIVVLRETRQRKWKRLRREVKRVGLLRFLDVIAFRLFYRLASAAKDRAWEDATLSSLCERYTEPSQAKVIIAPSPNTSEVEQFLKSVQPDMMLARCKTLLNQRIFSIPASGTFVMHPGICPEYRNAHGCFWAMVRGDYERIGMTLLRIDPGVDTGPVYDYHYWKGRPGNESHFVIQHAVVLDNLDRLADKLQGIHAGTEVPLDTNGRESRAWGQPWLTAWLKWKISGPRR
ncbi:MAG TPA: formyltransferase family protein [Bryobacteraceae bacterium]|nr:formyltransferase family protein [Bryobacteraceae bacterium]